MSDDLSRESEIEPSGDGKQEAKASKDILPVLRGWDHEPGTINVRKINGNDGLPKLQMRLELGLLQMEVTGRPDGVKPHGHESLLDYFENQLADHKRRYGTQSGFHLSTSQCQSLRDEAVMYYHRYLSLFVLEDFSGVVRDTARNLRVLDLCGNFAEEEQDRLELEQYRPYITMMHARARASMYMHENNFAQALKIVDEGLAEIKDFFLRFGQDEAYSASNEVRVLKGLSRTIRKKLPVDPVQKLQRQLDRAVKSEKYEEAARLRDKLAAMQQTGGAGEGSAKAD